MRMDVFDANAERLGAHTDADKARLIEVDRATMWRYRTGRLTPGRDKAMSIADLFGLKVEELFEVAS
jgi:DNA-binding XRE family transcriptional regulator